MEGKPADQEPHCCHSELPLRHRGKEVSEGAGEHRGGLEPRGFRGREQDCSAWAKGQSLSSNDQNKPSLTVRPACLSPHRLTTRTHSDVAGSEGRMRQAACSRKM